MRLEDNRPDRFSRVYFQKKDVPEAEKDAKQQGLNHRHIIEFERSIGREGGGA